VGTIGPLALAVTGPLSPQIAADTGHKGHDGHVSCSVQKVKISFNIDIKEK
jgi:hypothetical protein